MTVKHKIHFESDFIASVKLPEAVGDNDFSLDFFTTSQTVVKFYRQAGKLSANLKAEGDNNYLAVFRNHGLLPGKLTGKVKYAVNNELSPDGEILIASKLNLPYELTRGVTDIAELPEIVIVGTPEIEEPSTGGNEVTPPANFIIYAAPIGGISADQMNVTTITSPYPIDVYDLSNVRYKKQFGNVWFDTMGEATISNDRKTLTLVWNIVKENYPVGTALILEIPAGSITATNGAKNLELIANVNIVG